ncbi:MAG TPA: hypothetical protein PLL20_20305 [Phycisphaerae bacterium]|nr:hypothetical protein [Phycisphaerae bacterium]HRR86620.1 hypothetical protein [Phycisphaerae bacterium]
MSRASEPVLVVVLDRVVTPALARLLMRRGWPLLRATSASQAVQRIRDAEPETLVIQVSLDSAETLDLLDRVRRLRPGMPVVTVATYEGHELERTVRAVGVSCYMASADPELIEQAVLAMVGATTPSGASLAHGRYRPQQAEPVTQVVFSLPKTVGAAAGAAPERGTRKKKLWPEVA